MQISNREEMKMAMKTKMFVPSKQDMETAILLMKTNESVYYENGN
jgi:hypothetical protein